jgi:FkbM family methyltransferase
MPKTRILTGLVVLGSIGLGGAIGTARIRLWPGAYCSNIPAGAPYSVRWGALTYQGVTGNYIDDEIRTCGRFEATELELLTDLLNARGPSAVFVDVGANVGAYALYLSQTAGTVIAIEPFPPVFERLVAAIRANALHNVKAFRIGYSDVKGVLPFVEPPALNQGTGSFELRGRQATMQLPLEVGDEHLRLLKIGRVDVIKIDVEGYERRVVRGLRQIIRSSSPAVLVEWNRGEDAFNDPRYFSEAFPVGYRFLAVQPHTLGILPLNSGRWVFGSCVTGDYRLEPLGEFKEGWNVLAVPESLYHLVASRVVQPRASAQPRRGATLRQPDR